MPLQRAQVGELKGDTMPKRAGMILNKFERRLVSDILQKVIDNMEKQTEEGQTFYRERYEDWRLQLTEGQYFALQSVHSKLTEAE